MQIDVFNGDADGICALIQLRLAQPKTSLLVTGVKRDIELLSRVQANAEDQISVLDISLAKNITDLQRLLSAGAEIFYVDHHQAGDIPIHPRLTTLIDTDPNLCTSLLVNHYLQNQFAAWAVVAAFGDNLEQSAIKTATELALSENELHLLKNLGICINYNSYGHQLSDLPIQPDKLYQQLIPYHSPLDFIQDQAELYQQLLHAYQQDLTVALATPTEFENQNIAVYLLPDLPWSRRISGVFGNELANRFPQRAHAILTINSQNGYLISVRAPLINKTGADELCSAFATGGGRKGAAGINHLPIDQLPTFIQKFAQQYA